MRGKVRSQYPAKAMLIDRAVNKHSSERINTSKLAATRTFPVPHPPFPALMALTFDRSKQGIENTAGRGDHLRRRLIRLLITH